MEEPPDFNDEKVLDRIEGSMIGLAIGDALGAHVEFRSHQFLVEYPVTDFQAGGPWSLQKGQVKQIAEGSYKKPGGYDDGIRGKGYIINALEAALWAFWSDDDSFERGALAAVNLGDDTDTTAAIYGQLAGAYYGYKKLPQYWVQYIYAKKFMLNLSNWIAYEGEMWRPSAILFPDISSSPSQPYLNEMSTKTGVHEPNLNRDYSQSGATSPTAYSSESNETEGAKKNENPKKHLYNLSDTFRKHSMSPSMSSMNKGKVKYHNTISYFTFDSQSEEVINATPFNKLKSNKHSSSPEESFYPVNSINYSEETSHDNKPHKLILPNPESNSSTDECISPTWTPSNKRRSDPGVRNSTSIVERRSFDKNVESSENMKFSSRAAPQNPVSINHFNANKHGDLITREENCLPQDPLPLPQSSRRNSKDASSTLTTSEFRTDERYTNIQCVDRPNYDEFHSQDTIDEQTKDNQLSQKPAVLDLDQCLSWSCEDVCVWIKSCGEIYATYIDGFKRHNVDGYHLLHFVDNKALREFGVESSYNRRVIMHGIKNLKQQCTVPLLSNIPSLNDYDNEFDGDFVPPLYLSDNTYPNTMSCILQPLQNNIHSKVYNRILKWIGPLPDEIDIDKIEIIHNADLYRMFLQQIKRTERRQTQPEFKPNLNAETNPVERRKVLDYLQMLAQEVHHNRRVPIVRAWHGCRRANLPKLLSDGFAALSKLDKGWYGTAMYLTSSAEYAAKYTDYGGCLIMCYVVLLNPFPVITDDAPLNVSSSNFRFYGRGNYSNYQCHYIPVAPVNKDTHWNFRPPPNGVEDATYDELAVFQQADILPQVVVHLKSKTTSSNYISSDGGNQERIFLSKD
ncbi:unnamed protein product [Rotaria sordida]|uniref:ADP-ribosylhydrolase ARH3 n=2 Tax=Rotaria sordida TaxID=392033 RepID=A0A814PPK3_9BILA|nr:unnamed protein product [Rotaria sordida]